VTLPLAFSISGVIFDDTLSFKQFCLKSASAASFFLYPSLSMVHDHPLHDFRSHLGMSLTLSCLDNCPFPLPVPDGLAVCRPAGRGFRYFRYAVVGIGAKSLAVTFMNIDR